MFALVIYSTVNSRTRGLKAALPPATSARRQLGPEELSLQTGGTNGKRGGNGKLEQAHRRPAAFQPGWFCRADVIFPRAAGRVTSRV